MKKLLFILGMCFSINASTMTFQAIEDGEIYGYFAGATAGYDSKLSLTINGYQSEAFIHDHLSVIGDRINFGFAHAGDTIVFNLEVLTTGDTFYSIPSLNPDSLLNHMRYAQHDNSLFIGFEDLLYGGDLDFDDNNAFFSNISAVPEPDAYMVLLVGLLLVSLSVKRDSWEAI